jgi:hypothetical protein
MRRVQAKTCLVIPGLGRKAESPESITTGRAMDSGLATFGGAPE